MILTPYFLSKPSTEAITTEAQSVSGMKPIFTSFFSGASEPCGPGAAGEHAGEQRGAAGGAGFLDEIAAGGFEGAVRLLRHAELLVAKEEEKERKNTLKNKNGVHLSPALSG
jgi:hypothetical protein